MTGLSSVNKLADLADLDRIAYRVVADEILKLESEMDSAGIPTNHNLMWFRQWEYATALINSGVRNGTRVLDAGGCRSVFSIYLSRRGCEVYSIDILPDKAMDSHRAADTFSLPLHASTQDISALAFPDNSFDFVFCVCVIEHIPPFRQPKAMVELARVLRPGGIAFVSFDYGPAAMDWPILDAQDVFDRIVVPSGLVLVGDPTFDTRPHASGGSDPDYTFGAVFLTKPRRLS